MCWEYDYYGKEAVCACGKGKVIKHCYQANDDWNSRKSGCVGIEIQCPDWKTMPYKNNTEILSWPA